MHWTEKYTEILLTAIAGMIAGILLSILTGLGKLSVQRIEARRRKKERLAEYRRAIMYGTTADEVSGDLWQLKAFLVAHGELLDKPHIREFFDEWLMDPGIGQGEVHWQLGVMEGAPAMEKVRRDAESKLRF